MNDFALNLWLGSGIFLMATELLLPGLVMVFVGMGALTVAISMYFGYVDGYVHQLMIFFISSSIYLSTLRFLVLRFVPTDTRNENKTNLTTYVCPNQHRLTNRRRVGNFTGRFGFF